MRNTPIDQFEDLPRDVLLTANDYAAASVFPMHTHQRGQFALAACGSISIATPAGRWLVPPQRACWLPAGVQHEMTMRGAVTMLNAFVASDKARTLGMPDHCQVFGVSVLLRQLLEQAIDVPPLYELEGHAGKLMDLLLAEMAAMLPLSLHAPLPRDVRLLRVCRQVFEAPSIAFDIDAMAQQAGMSRRTFTRLFRAGTGVSFAEWRQQVCLLAAIERLGEGQPVTRVALDLGYASPSAFSSAFRRVLGTTPSQYLA